MTAGELLAIIRADYLDDVVVPYNWETASLLREMARAQQQACWRQDLRHFFDSASFNITLVEGRRDYALDPAILRIESVRYGADKTLLRHVTQTELDRRNMIWILADAGPPTAFYIEGRSLYLDRTPSAVEADEVLQLAVWHGPLTEPTDITESDELEWEQDTEKLAHWVAYRAFMRRDEDTHNKELAQMHLALFEQAFGAEVPARARAELLTHPAETPFSPIRQRPVLLED